MLDNPHLKHPTQVQIETMMESCVVKTIGAGVGGFVLGGLMGVALVALDPQGECEVPSKTCLRLSLGISLRI